MSELLPYQQRLLKERDELVEKTDKLRWFICHSVEFEKLVNEERENLQAQLSYMEGYAIVLGRRIDRFYRVTCKCCSTVVPKDNAEEIPEINLTLCHICLSRINKRIMERIAANREGRRNESHT